MKVLDTFIKTTLILILIICICSVVYLVVIHNPGEGYTEFYILDSNNNITNYPTNISHYSINKIYIGIYNHENEETNYTIKVKYNNSVLTEYNKTLKDNERIKTPYYLDSSNNMGDNQVITIDLYKNNNSNPYRSLNIRYNVIS